MNCKKKMDWWATLAAIAVFVAGPAAAVPGLGWYQSDYASGNNDAPRTVTASCPPGKQVIGGGAVVDDLGRNQVVLIRLEPIHGGTQDRYVASAEGPYGFSGNWSLYAYAICADPLPGYQIVPNTVTASPTATFVATAAVCPSGKLVTGTGSRILNSRGVVGLQLSRASGPLDISRSTARERMKNNYNSPIEWSLTSYAICAYPVGLKTESAVTYVASTIKDCSTGKAHSGGGGGGLVDNSGPVFLKSVFVDPFLRFVEVEMTGVPAIGMVTQAICGP